jgi:hypothetical protein
LLIVLALVWWAWPAAPDPYYSEQLASRIELRDAFRGIAIERVPRQTSLEDPAVVRVDDLEVRLQATFDLAARVLGRRDYRRGDWARLSPMDLALGWGPMSDPEILSRIDIRQRGRFYFWQVDEFPIPRHLIEQSSANMHIVPADPALLGVLEAIEEGDEIRLSGYLIDVDRDDGGYWRTSLRRDDTGDGACELFLVTAVARY